MGRDAVSMMTTTMRRERAGCPHGWPPCQHCIKENKELLADVQKEKRERMIVELLGCGHPRDKLFFSPGNISADCWCRECSARICTSCKTSVVSANARQLYCKECIGVETYDLHLKSNTATLPGEIWKTGGTEKLLLNNGPMGQLRLGPNPNRWLKIQGGGLVPLRCIEFVDFRSGAIYAHTSTDGFYLEDIKTLDEFLEKYGHLG